MHGTIVVGDRNSVNPREDRDWRRIRFPSDRLTMAQLRRVVHGDSSQLIELVDQLVSLESTVARYMRTARTDPAQSTQRRVHEAFGQEHAKELVTLYTRVGLAGGKHEANQLVREWLTSLSNRDLPPARR
jgi:hypothetical protein